MKIEVKIDDGFIDAESSIQIKRKLKEKEKKDLSRYMREEIDWITDSLIVQWMKDLKEEIEVNNLGKKNAKI